MGTKKDMEKDTEQDFESQLAKLQNIVLELESEDAPLEKSMRLFKQGMELGRDCQKRLEQARKEVAIYLDGNWQEFRQEDESAN